MLGAEQINAITGCISATSSVLALIGLAFYVRYTKRMMGAGDATLRANLEPIIVPDVEMSNLLDGRNLRLNLTNEGKGPALQLSYVQIDDDKLRQDFGNFQEFVGEMGRKSLGTLRAEHPEDAKLLITVRKPTDGESTLIVIVYKDYLNTWHQCQIIYRQVDQLSWHTQIAYSRKASSFPVSRYKYPKDRLRTNHLTK